MDRLGAGGGNQPPHFRGRPVSGLEAAHASEYFEPFLNATTLKNILGYHRSMCEFLHLKPNVFTHFYPKLRANLTSWRAKALWKRFDARAAHKCYGKGKFCTGTKVLVIGAGPCGLRTAIELQLLGAKVVVIEKRDRLSRNNVLHLWPFVIEDLRMLGAKKFFGKFCAGSIDHISIRQLQCILLKIALLLGVEVHTEVSFEKLVEPNATEKTGWRAEFKPENHPVSQYEFDVIIGADGKRNTLQGFKRKEFRGKLAIAITANFINKKTEAEARVEEISGVAFIFNQKFFKDLYEVTRIDLENIVYYKDDTHYFVMTAKKSSLLEKGVIKQDLADTEKLLAPDNVDRDALQNYAREAADFSTNYQMPDLEFAVNHYGQPDVAMFDFTSMYAAEYASKVLERNGHRLLMILVGDSLLEPFWPTGSGCARGFLSSLDAAWAIRSWSMGTITPLDVLAERESIYRLLAQTTPDNLNKDWKSYTLDPATRYPNLNKTVVLPHQTVCLYDTDNPQNIDKMKRSSLDARSELPKKRRRGNVDRDILLNWLTEQLRELEGVGVTDLESVFKDGKVLCALIHHYRPDLLDYGALKDSEPAQRNQLAMDILEKDLGIPPIMTGEEITNTEDYLALASYLTQVYDTFRGEIPHIKHPKLELPPESHKRSDFSFKSIRTYQPSLPTVAPVTSRPSSRHKRHADVMTTKVGSLEKKQRKRRTLERVGPSIDHENRVTGLKPQTNTNADEDIASKIRSLEDKWTNPQPTEKKPKDLLRAIGKIETSDWNIKEIEKKILENKIGKPSSANKDKERVPKWSREEFRARQTKMEKKHLDRQDSNEAKYADIDKNIKQLDLKLKEGTTRELGQNKVASITQKLVSRVPVDETKPAVEKPSPKAPFNLPPQKASEFCHFCSKRVYLMERLSAEGRFFHHGCFKCQYCHTQLRLGSYTFDRDGQYGHRFFCIHHYGMQGELPQPIRVARKPSQRGLPEEKRANDKQLSGVSGVDLLDRVKTPERIEFSNLSTGNISSDHEEPLSQMDEDEWTDKNFGASCAELDDSDDSSSSLSDTDSDDEDAYDDALEEPATKEGTMKWAERLKNSYRKGRGSYSDGYSSSDHSSYYENTSDDSDSETATEGEEEIRARELRKKEVCVDPPVPQTDTGTDTEIVTDESSSDSSSEIRNSATEISTDSEFAQDDPTPTREIPSIVFNDFYVTKTRGSGARNYPKKIQVTSGYLQRPTKEKSKPNIELKLTPLVPSTSVFKKPALLPRTEGYALNRTQSTGGIAAKVSLELKKKYLLGENGAGSIQKSGSASTLDTKFKSFQTTISDCQKLLKPATEVSASMQMFCSKLDERHSPLASPQSSVFFANKKEESLPPPDITITTTVEKTDREEHSSDSLSVSSSDNEEAKAPFQFDNIPRVEVHHADHKEETLLDSLSEVVRKEEPSQEHGKSVGSDKKSLNGPKSLPDLEGALPEIHQALHVKKSDKEDSPEENRSLKNASGKSSPTALTETELSDWARDGNVSDDMEFDFSHGIGKNKLQETTKPGGVTSTGVLDANLDSIEFMDYGTETSSDDAVVDSQNGYVLFKDEDELAEDSLAPNVCEILEAKNVYLTQMTDQRYGGEVIDLKPTDLEKMKRQPRTEPEDDSLLIIETGNTTEENTCSDSTVKNLTEISANKDKPQPLKLENFQKQRLEEKLAMVKAEQALLKEQKMKENLEFNEHCQRLQSKIEFGNARDSIDIRKSRRKSRTELPSIAAVKPDLIQEEENRPVPSKEITLDLKSAVQTPDLLYKKENIKKERDDNQRLIQEMVMNKMKAENKSLERKKRNRLGVNNMSPSRSQEQKTDIVSQINRSNLEKSLKSTPDLLSNSIPLQNSQTVNKTLNNTRPLSVFSTFTDVKRVQDMSVEKGSLPDIRKNLFAEAPKAPPRYNRPSDPSRTAEKLKESAKARAKLLSNEDLGLSPEDKLNKLRDKFSRKNKDENVIPLIQESIESLVINTERRNSLLYAKDTLSKKRNGSFRRSKSRDEEGKAAEYTKADYDEYPTRTKSVSEFPKAVRCGEQKDGEKKICKSDPNLLDAAPQLRKKCKDRERRKSITKLIANIFTKKSPTGNGNKGLFARLSPKTKSVSKSCTELDMILREIASEDPQRRNSVSEKIAPKRESTPPPVPPLPSNYTVKGTDESSDAEPEWRRLDQSSCDTLDKSGILETSTSSLTGRKGGKHRRQSRQAQLKRHRMAQEIQRKLEETEVKTRELEQRGVLVEKALRGEGANECMKDESELLQEWFDLMKDRTELRRYEKELMIRAQELELEDRHARLQAELRERLEAGTSKTEQDTQTEQGIINEMLDIVAKRDSLIAVLEEDRVRYSTEDKDLEEQMLTKGLMLTPIAKTSDK
ncbi:F-actin-monooxygenase Mical isoform X2 [Cylas formicarius]|uniref:F-actin-monooxygenase Mical isoform X2 n=1 Tax=Cylas formicarius TaxID=197179 RepID=UPI0029586FCA|nr:F-actin-monooxygenase Mical isoform X2 [Cylas formicarius]